MQHLVGQNGHVERFNKLISEGKLGSTYLFSGPSGTGKAALVLDIARQIFCKDPIAGKACGQCPGCKKMEKLQHPNFHFVHELPSSKSPSPRDPYRGMEKKTFDLIQPAEQEFAENPYLGFHIDGATQIRIASIRYLIRNLGMRPAEEGKQIVMIHLAEKTNRESFNAMLKTLEEPPANTHFFLTTESLQSIPITIRSRCQIVKFNPLPMEEIRSELIRKGKSEQRADQLARLCEGSVHTMFDLLDSNLQEEDVFVLNFWRIVMGAKVNDHWVSMDDVSKLSEELVALAKSDPQLLKARFQLVIYWLRDAQQLEATQNSDLMIFKHLEKEIANFILFYPQLPYYDMLLLVEETYKDSQASFYKPAVMGRMLMNLRMTILEHRKK